MQVPVPPYEAKRPPVPHLADNIEAEELGALGHLEGPELAGGGDVLFLDEGD